MKPSAFIINCARGPIIDETALCAALSNGQIAGAGLDVMEDAAPGANHPLFAMDNVLITPHVAFLSQQAVHELSSTGSVAMSALGVGNRHGRGQATRCRNEGHKSALHGLHAHIAIFPQRFLSVVLIPIDTGIGIPAVGIMSMSTDRQGPSA